MNSLPNPAFVDSFVLSGSAGVPAELVDQARDAARSVGYAQGWSQGHREAAEKLAASLAAAEAERAAQAAVRAERLDSALQAVQAAASRLDQTVVQLTDEISDKILAAAVELARALLGQQLREPEVAASAALARVLGQAPDNEPITVWLSSQDFQSLTGDGGAELIAELDATVAGRINFECDPALAIGDATARSAATSIDARLSTAIARLREYTA